MPGRVSKVNVRPGERVAAGQALVVLEAMKMEHALSAPVGGVVLDLDVGEGDQVAEGIVVARIEAVAEGAPR
jgi:biotin carboxyl carrier protein